jgi:hypothetical protein
MQNINDGINVVCSRQYLYSVRQLVHHALIIHRYKDFITMRLFSCGRISF